jgi:hypothetical protein
MPEWMQGFFSPLRKHLSVPQYHTLLIFLLGWIACPRRPKLDHIAQSQPGRHRTTLGYLLHHAQWDPQNLLTLLVLSLLRLLSVRDEDLYLLLDDTLIRKRGKRMAAVSPLYDHAVRRTYRAHRVLVAAIVVRDIILPWRFVLWQPKTEGQPYVKVTTLAARLIRDFPKLQGVNMKVLFDAYYLNATVIQACQERGFHWFSVASRNRRFTALGQKKSVKLSQWAPGRLRHEGKKLQRPRARGRQIVWRQSSVVGHLSKVGQVKLVLAKRWREPYRQMTVFATSDTRLSSKAILAVYERRWMIEQLFKDLKGSLGLGQYQMQSQEGITKHLHLCGVVHLTLTRQSLETLDAPARKSKDALTLPSLNERLALTQQAIKQHRITKALKRTRIASVRRSLRRLLNLAA